ncbi:unnamed protein product [Pieris brassicae]|uniref:Uncharacterized protein n=1 Tax=Pieris brassicae TaxID=7116 RepID=A0A9P0SB07_PIEBR|nr:unnamed protein product [Pieris brassicae]
MDPDEDQIESPTLYYKLPHPADRPIIKYSDAETPVQTAIFTDGSKTPNGVGAAWIDKVMSVAEMPSILRDSRPQFERFCKEIVTKTRQMNGRGGGGQGVVRPTAARP